jgi:hypothetical protein
MLPQHPLLASSLRYRPAAATTTTISTFQHTSDTPGRHHAYVFLRLLLCSLKPPSSLLWWDEQQQSFTLSQLTNYCRPQEEAWVQISLSFSLFLSLSLSFCFFFFFFFFTLALARPERTPGVAASYKRTRVRSRAFSSSSSSWCQHCKLEETLIFTNPQTNKRQTFYQTDTHSARRSQQRFVGMVFTRRQPERKKDRDEAS